MPCMIAVLLFYFFFQMRAEDADVLIMLLHCNFSTNHPLFFTTPKGS